MVIAHQELHHGKGDSRHQGHRPDLPNTAPSGHGTDDPKGNDGREDRELPAGHLRELHHVEVSDLGQRRDRDADATEGHRSRIGDEGQPTGVDWRESQLEQQGRGDGHRSAKTGRPLDEGAETEGDEDDLDPRIGGYPHELTLQILEEPRLDRQGMQEHHIQHDPSDGK